MYWIKLNNLVLKSLDFTCILYIVIEKLNHSGSAQNQITRNFRITTQYTYRTFTGKTIIEIEVGVDIFWYLDQDVSRCSAEEKEIHFVHPSRYIAKEITSA